MLIRDALGVALDPEALPLTGPQRAALAIDRHVVVTAGAGSGKTHTLAWRYVRLLVERARQGHDDVTAVVVLTFTEKAAEEMAERCNARLAAVARRARELDPDGPVTARLERMLDQFDQARIGTFHGFCARILREFPLSAGVPADFEVLEPIDTTALRTQAAEDALSAWVDGKDARLGLVLDAFGSRRALLAALSGALDRYRTLEEQLVRHAEDTVRLPDTTAQTEAAREWLTRVGVPAIKAVEQLTRPGGTKFSAGLRPLIGPLPDEPLALHARLQRVLDALIDGKGGLRALTHHAYLGTRAAWSDARRYAQAKAALEALSERLQDWPERAEVARHLPTAADARLLEALVPFAALAMSARANLRAALSERRALDFDALQDDAVDAVLRDADLRATLRDRHRWLMVDEFQDTDPRQWAMVRALGDALPDEPADRVFLVGDVKQAIYGFRGGEVGLFAEAVAHLQVEPLELPHNFRSRPSLIAWFNVMFPAVIPEIWSPLAPGRDAGAGSVTWLDADDVAAQAEATAGMLREALQDGRFGDLHAPAEPPVAILLRARTNLAVWERALARAGLPWRVAQGVGFWRRPEVLDVVNLVHAAATGDPLSTVGVLRGPLLGASDAEVHDHVTRGAPSRASVRLLELAEARHDGPVVDWLRATLDATDAWRSWDAAARGNVRQLLDRIAGWDARIGHLPGLADRLLARVHEVPRDTEATPTASAARVVVLTVHAAKGLEFPVVVIPELQGTPRDRPDPLTIARVDGQMVLAMGVDDPGAAVQTRATPALLARARDVLKAQGDAEYRRLLYVAATRARDHLVLVGPTEANERSWAGLLASPPADTVWLRPTPVDVDLEPPARVGWVSPSPAPLTLDAPTEVTASDLVGWSACAARWFRTARLGLREPGEQPVARVLAGVRGRVLHGAIEDRVLDDPDRVARRFRALAVGLDPDDVARGLEVLESHRRRAAGDPTLAQALSAPGFDELGLRTPFAGGVFVGRIDRLVLDREAGGFLVFDYKTEHVGHSSEADLTAAHALQLRAYGWAADQVLQARGQPGVVGGRLYFTERSRWLALGPWSEADHGELPAVLADVAGTRTLDQAFARARTQQPPCATCGFRGRGCPGVDDHRFAK